VLRNNLRSTMNTLRLRNIVILSVERQLTDGIVFDNVNGEFPTENKNNYFVESCSFHFRNKDGTCGYTHFFLNFYPYMSFLLL